MAPPLDHVVTVHLAVKGRTAVVRSSRFRDVVESILRQEFVARDESALTAALHAVFGAGTATTEAAGEVRYGQRSIVDDGVALTRITSSGARVRVTNTPAPDLVVLAVHRGTLHRTHADQRFTLTPGALTLMPIGYTGAFAWEEVAFDAYSFSPATVGRLLGTDLVPTLRVNRLVSDGTPVSRLWLATARHLVDQVMQDRALFESDLIREQAVDALLAITIEAFGIEAAPQDASRPGTEVLIAAERWMRAHLGDPVTVPDIARGVGVSVRALQLAYRNDALGTALLRLRRLRMEAARDAFAVTDGPPPTIGAIARRFAYTNLGRFSAHYREAFGELPTDALRRSPDDDVAG